MAYPAGQYRLQPHLDGALDEALAFERGTSMMVGSSINSATVPRGFGSILLRIEPLGAGSRTWVKRTWREHDLRSSLSSSGISSSGSSPSVPWSGMQPLTSGSSERGETLVLHDSLELSDSSSAGTGTMVLHLVFMMAEFQRRLPRSAGCSGTKPNH